MQAPITEIVESITIPRGRVCRGATQQSWQFTVFAKACFEIHPPTYRNSDGSSPTTQLHMEEENPALTPAYLSVVASSHCYC